MHRVKCPTLYVVHFPSLPPPGASFPCFLHYSSPSSSFFTFLLILLPLLYFLLHVLNTWTSSLSRTLWTQYSTYNTGKLSSLWSWFTSIYIRLWSANTLLSSSWALGPALFIKGSVVTKQRNIQTRTPSGSGKSLQSEDSSVCSPMEMLLPLEPIPLKQQGPKLQEQE